MIRQISILGTGTMGRGIAYLSAVAGYDTVMFDAEAGALDAARAAVESILRKGVEKGKLGAGARGLASLSRGRGRTSTCGEALDREPLPRPVVSR